MRKLLCLLVAVCYMGVIRGQLNKPEKPPYTLERALRILTDAKVIDNAVYDKRILKYALPVDIPLTNPCDSLLRAIMDAQPYFRYRMVLRTLTINLKPKAESEKALHHFTSTLHAKILGDSAVPLSGATVRFKSKAKGMAADKNGYIQLMWTPADTLLISYINHKTFALPWQITRNLLTIHLERVESQPEATATIIGYSFKNKVSTAGLSRFKPEPHQTATLAGAIQQNVAGFLAPPVSGLPGVTQKVRFRGPTSIGPLNAILERPLNTPLYIVNGIPWAPSQQAMNQLPSIAGDPNTPGISASGFDPFFTINFYDVESITVLKDAEATAIYGARGANGVILINTKKPAGKKQLNIISSYGFGRALPSMDLMNTQQYIDMRQEAFANDGLTPNPVTAPDLLVWDTTRYTDFKKVLLNGTARYHDQQISFSDGDSVYRYLLSGGYHSQGTVLPADLHSKRWSLLGDISFSSKNKKLKTGVSCSYSYSQNKWITENIMYGLLLAPNAPALKNSAGNLVWKENEVSFNNPLSFFNKTNYVHANNTLLNTWLHYKILPNLRFETSLGYHQIGVTEINRVPISAWNPDDNPRGSITKAGNRYITWNIEPGIHYNLSFGKLHIESMAGASYTTQINKRFTHRFNGYTNDDLLGIESAAAFAELSSNRTKYLFLSAFSRIKFNYKNRYFLSLTGRRDGSSRFGSEYRYANFGAVGAGWIFWNKRNQNGLLHYAKIRGSYGTTGNDQIGDYQFLNTWTTIANYQGTPGITPAGLANQYYRWEITRKMELGLEVSLFNKQVNISVTGYNNRSKNQLISYALPSQSGFGTVITNFPAVVQNYGLEAEADWKKEFNNFIWSGKLVFAIPKNRLLQFDNLENTAYRNKLQLQQPLNNVMGFHHTGVDPTTGLYTVDSSDKRVIPLDPICFGSLRNSFQLYRFELTTLLEFRKQQAPHYLVSFYNYLPPGQVNALLFSNQPVDFVNRWRKPGDQASWQQVSTRPFGAINNAINNWVNAAAQMADASYIRMKYIKLRYALPPGWLNKHGIGAASVFVNIDNLFTITSYKGADPELQNPFSLPLLRTYTIGFHLTL